MKKDSKKIFEVIKKLKKGEVIILPTDTVYGLFCRAFDKQAVKKIYKIKGRDFSKPLQVFLSKKTEIFKYCKLNNRQKKYINKYLPGPYTLILELRDKYKKFFSFLKDTIGVRIIKYKLLNEIIKKTGPLAATSANLSGEPTPVKYNDIHPVLLEKLFAFQDDSIVRGKASQVIDLTGEKLVILRK
ncbi:MAG: L-threonylcarbamoyladenylate synthase [Candidatus Goldbacteria bacterium]|nr:L-threonylcarbamoyladenylate synthase [Candidatus Goldiibacteriota bacterium]